MKIKKGFVVRTVGGECVAVPVGEMSKNFHGMINLNGTAEFLWNFYSEEHSLDEGVAALLNEYDVDESLARADVERFMGILLKNGFAE
ncbi:MAG: PqqD family protein [Clostridia bacterium]|nr:PqqD family protein [Clostridia bacterium]